MSNRLLVSALWRRAKGCGQGTYPENQSIRVYYERRQRIGAANQYQDNLNLVKEKV